MKVMNIDVLAYEDEGLAFIVDLEDLILNDSAFKHVRIVRCINRYSYERTNRKYTIFSKITGLSDEQIVMLTLKHSGIIQIKVNRLP